jgi:hypothetical protein
MVEHPLGCKQCMYCTLCRPLHHVLESILNAVFRAELECKTNNKKHLQ